RDLDPAAAASSTITIADTATSWSFDVSDFVAKRVVQFKQPPSGTFSGGDDVLLAWTPPTDDLAGGSIEIVFIPNGDTDPLFDPGLPSRSSGRSGVAQRSCF